MASGSAEPGQAKTLTAAHGAESFRTGWQALLASLGTDQAAVETPQENMSTETLPQASEKASSVATDLTAGTTLSVLPEAKAAGSEASATAKTLLTSTQKQITAAQQTGEAKTAVTLADKTEAKKPAADAQEKTSRSAKADAAGNTAQTVETAAASAPDTTVSSVPQDVPVSKTPVTDSLSAQVSEEQTSSTTAAELSTDLSAALAAVSPGQQQVNSGNASVPETSSPSAGDGQKDIKDVATLTGQEKPSSTANATTSAALATGAETPAVSRGQDKTTLDVSAAASGTDSSQNFMSQQNAKPMMAQGQSTTTLPQTNQTADNSTVTASSLLAASDGANVQQNAPLAATAAASVNQTAETVSVADTTVAAGSAKSTASNASRSTRTASSAASVQTGTHLAAEEISSAGTALDAATITRAGGGAHTTANASTAAAQDGTGSTTELTSGKAFAALDTADATEKATWLHTGTQRAEAGFQDASLGWVSVRANLEKGGVHAELVASSQDAAQVLGSHMAELNAYLAEQHTPVRTLTLSSSSPESGWTGLSSGTGTGEGMQQNTGQQTGQQMTQNLSVDTRSSLSSAATLVGGASSKPSVWPETLDRNTQAGHISVIA